MCSASFCLLFAALAQAPAADVADLRRLDRADEALVYRVVDGRELKLHMFRPPEAVGAEGVRRPAMLIFHGGGWKGGDPSSMAPHCRYFASRGLVCFTAEYRLLDQQPKADGSPVLVSDLVEDARTALQYVVEHAEELRVDPQRLIVSGGSAGGHLALMTVLPPGVGPPVQACVLYNPVTVTTPQPTLPDSYNELMTGRTPGMHGGKPAEVCPLTQLGPDAPPMLMMFGTEDDRYLPPAQLFREKCVAAGNQCTLELWEGQKHAFYGFGRRGTTTFKETCARADRFLAELDLLSGEPNVKTFVDAHR